MTAGLDGKRVKNTSLEAKPPAHGFIENKFDGESNPDQHEQYDYGSINETNRFPREKGSDSAGPFTEGDFAG